MAAGSSWGQGVQRWDGDLCLLQRFGKLEGRWIRQSGLRAPAQPDKRLPVVRGTLGLTLGCGALGLVCGHGQCSLSYGDCVQTAFPLWTLSF